LRISYVVVGIFLPLWHSRQDIMPVSEADKKRADGMTGRRKENALASESCVSHNV